MGHPRAGGDAGEKGKRHIVTTKFEHHAVLHTVERLQREGFEATFLDVHENGIVRIEEVAAALREDTALVTIMYANNEIGTIQPIAEIGRCAGPAAFRSIRMRCRLQAMCRWMSGGAD